MYPSVYRSTAVVALALVLLAGCTASRQSLREQPPVSEAQARRTALAVVPHGVIQSSELEQENGRLVWSLDMALPGTADVREVLIDARNGDIISSALETPAQQNQEAREPSSGT